MIRSLVVLRRNPVLSVSRCHLPNVTFRRHECATYGVSHHRRQWLGCCFTSVRPADSTCRALPQKRCMPHEGASASPGAERNGRFHVASGSRPSTPQSHRRRHGHRRCDRPRAGRSRTNSRSAPISPTASLFWCTSIHSTRLAAAVKLTALPSDSGIAYGAGAVVVHPGLCHAPCSFTTGPLLMRAFYFAFRNRRPGFKLLRDGIRSRRKRSEQERS